MNRRPEVFHSFDIVAKQMADEASLENKFRLIEGARGTLGPTQACKVHNVNYHHYLDWRKRMGIAKFRTHKQKKVSASAAAVFHSPPTSDCSSEVAAGDEQYKEFQTTGGAP